MTFSLLILLNQFLNLNRFNIQNDIGIVYLLKRIHIISNSFYFEVGSTASRKPDIFMEEGWKNGYSLGIETAAFYYTGKIHLGLRISGTMNFEMYDSNMFSDDTYYLLLITPLIIGFNF